MVGITAKYGQKIKDQNNMENSFYQSLYSNDTFTSAVGKLILSSAKLESMINVLLEVRGSKKTKKRPLGIMIQNLLEEINVDRTTEEHLKIILKERNYFTHNLYSNLSQYPTDDRELIMFINRAKSLATQMEFFSKLLQEKAKRTEN